MKKPLLFVFLLVLLVGLCACGRETPAETGPVESAETAGESSPVLDILPDRDFEGREFRIATDDPARFFPAGGSSFVGKAVYERNRLVEEKYHVKLTLTEESGTLTIADRLRTEALAGSDYCDLAIIGSAGCATLASSGALLNAKSVPYLHPERDWYYPGGAEGMTLKSQTFGLVGDLTFNMKTCYALFFNKTLCEMTGLPSLYELVSTNQWDLENFLLYAEEAYSLGKYNGLKIYGFNSSQKPDALIQAFWAAGGLQYVKNEYGSPPELIFNNETTEAFIKAMRQVLYRSTTYLTATGNAEESFRSGQTLFCIAPLSHAGDLFGSSFSVGIAPIPKLDINQDAYYSYCEESYQVACFLKSTPDLVFSGIVTEALFCASGDINETVYLKEYLNLYLSSPQDAEMLKEIVRSPYFDPARFFGRQYPAYLTCTSTLLYRVISADLDFDEQWKQYSKMFREWIEQNQIK